MRKIQIYLLSSLLLLFNSVYFFFLLTFFINFGWLFLNVREWKLMQGIYLFLLWRSLLSPWSWRSCFGIRSTGSRLMIHCCFRLMIHTRIPLRTLCWWRNPIRHMVSRSTWLRINWLVIKRRWELNSSTNVEELEICLFQQKREVPTSGAEFSRRSSRRFWMKSSSSSPIPWSSFWSNNIHFELREGAP